MENTKNDALDFPPDEPYPLKKLRQLVAAMTMPEKNAFKRYIRSYKDENNKAGYIQLFDCVNVCLTEDERRSKKSGAVELPEVKAATFYQKFKSRNAKRKVCKPAELGTKANYLFEKILESQRNVNIEKNPRRELYARMLDVQLLFAKDMREECLSMVRYAKKMAASLEALPQLLELMQIERRLLGMSRHDNLKKELRAIFESEKKYLEQLELATRFNDLRMEITMLQWSQIKVDGEEEVRKKINYFLDQVGHNLSLDTFDIASYYHAIYAGLIRLDMQHPSRFLEFLNHEGYKTTVAHYKFIVDLYSNYSARKKEDLLRYQNDLSNYLANAYVSGDAAANLEDYAEDLAKVKATDPDFLNFVTFVTLLDGIKGRHFKEARAFLLDNKVWELTGSVGRDISQSRLQIVRHLAGTVFFVKEEFEEAERWFRANLDTDARVVNKEGMTASELYHLLCRFELGSTKNITYKKVLLDDLSRRLELAVDPDSFESALLSAMGDILKTGIGTENLGAVCANHLPTLKERLDQKSEASHFHLFIGWLESKSTGKSLRVSVEPYL